MKSSRTGRFLAILAVLLGLLVGLGIFTFGYGEGISYFSTASETCANCHIMHDQYDSWSKSSHHAVAGCADCHLPHSFPAQYISKADNGFFHAWAFTFQNFHEPIQMKPRNRRILQNSCIECHSSMLAALPAEAMHWQEGNCVKCHANVGHAAKR